MQFALTLALAATASASFAVRGDDKPTTSSNGISKVINRCPYDVYLWSVHKQPGCPQSASTLVKKNGGEWQEKMQDTVNGGYSIKLSKFSDCGGKELTQLEYNIQGKGQYSGNYLDMSFVDCQKGGDCPGWKDGFYMESGKGKTGDVGVYAATENNEHCPILKASNPTEAAKVAYVLPDDRQTKYCQADADLTLYLCGDQAPGASGSAPSSAAPSSAAPSKPAAPSQPKPSTFQVLPSSSKAASAPSKAADDVKVKAAEVTAAPKAPAPEAPKAVKTVITYVTVSVDAPQKRHSHGRRHNRA